MHLTNGEFTLSIARPHLKLLLRFSHLLLVLLQRHPRLLRPLIPFERLPLMLQQPQLSLDLLQTASHRRALCVDERPNRCILLDEVEREGSVDSSDDREWRDRKSVV